MEFINNKSIITSTIIALSLTTFAGTANALTLRSAVRHTVETNPAVLLSAHTRQASKESVNVARAGYLPSLDLNAGIGHENTNSPATRFQYEDLTRHEFGVSLQQMIFDDFGTLNEVRRNQFKTNADAYAVSGQSNDQAVLAIESYLDILQNQRLVSITRDYYNRIRRIYKLVQQRSASGLGRKADLFQARSRLALSKASLYALKNRLRDAKTEFRKVTGLEPTNLVMPRPIPASYLARSRGMAVQRAVTNNPKLKASLADVAEAESQYKASKSVNYPRFDAFAGINRDKNISGQSGRNYNAFIMLRANFNLFNGFGDVSKQRENAYEVDRAADTRNQTLRELIQSVRFSWDSMQTAKVRIPALLAHRNAAYGTVQAYREQFSLGRRTLLDLLDSENELFTSSISYVREKYLLKVSKYRLMGDSDSLLHYFRVPLPPTAMIPYKEILVMPRIHSDVGIVNTDIHHITPIALREAESRRHISDRSIDELVIYELPPPREFFIRTEQYKLR